MGYRSVHTSSQDREQLLQGHRYHKDTPVCKFVGLYYFSLIAIHVFWRHIMYHTYHWVNCRLPCTKYNRATCVLTAKKESRVNGHTQDAETYTKILWLWSQWNNTMKNAKRNTAKDTVSRNRGSSVAWGSERRRLPALVRASQMTISIFIIYIVIP